MLITVVNKQKVFVLQSLQILLYEVYVHSGLLLYAVLAVTRTVFPKQVYRRIRSPTIVRLLLRTQVKASLSYLNTMLAKFRPICYNAKG